ncbi:MAG TPA: hypothetical protein VFQ39_04915, partial [Longimicrobium sp.]|nr:hypothetical protein [Longimicrobium sp.]
GCVGAWVRGCVGAWVRGWRAVAGEAQKHVILWPGNTLLALTTDVAGPQDLAAATLKPGRGSGTNARSLAAYIRV